MKFAYIDESGDTGQGDVFVMAGILIDATKLRKYTSKFDKKLTELRAQHPSLPTDFKTKRFINGTGGWRNVPAQNRKDFLTQIVDIATSCGKIYAIAFSFDKFDTAINGFSPLPKNQSNYWMASSMYISGLIQRKMRTESNNKGLTVLIFDDNKQHMPKLSDGLYRCDQWYDDLYSTPRRVRGNVTWEVKKENRFDHIINTAFAIKSEHSSLIQVADAISYIYRRYLELTSLDEAYEGERYFYESLVDKLNSKFVKIGRTRPSSRCIQFYEESIHPNWNL
tara:strand:- start:210 stop:1049 length:840 start_codon:yes stop_codon:yes gene_type:complete